MIQITESAAKRIAYLKDEEGQPSEAFLRVDIKKGGCSGLSYKLNFDTVDKVGDQKFSQFGQTIAVDAETYLYLAGMTLSYQGGLNGKGFIFDNPNAAKKCGCGISFNV